MDIEKLSLRLKFSVLSSTMMRFGIDPYQVDDKLDAIKILYETFESSNMPLEFTCPMCKADIPDLDDCPFCGQSFTDSRDSRTYIGARKGRRYRGYQGPDGFDMWKKLIEQFGIPPENIKYGKSVTSLWAEGRLICKCHVGVFSIRIQLPFLANEYRNNGGGIILNYPRSIKGMFSRVIIESNSDIAPVIVILKQTICLRRKKARSPRRRNVRRSS